MVAISNWIVRFLELHSSLQIAHRDWCVYALEKKLLKWACFLLVLIVGVFLHTAVESVLVFSSINFLRTKISGWHAQSPAICMAFTVSAACGGGAFAKWLAAEYAWAFVLLVAINICLCLFFTPVTNVRLHLTGAEMRQNTKQGVSRARLLMLISVLAFFVVPIQSFALCMQIGTCIAFASTFTAV